MGTKTLFNVQKYASKIYIYIYIYYWTAVSIAPWDITLITSLQKSTWLDWTITLCPKKEEGRKMTYSIFVYTL